MTQAKTKKPEDNGKVDARVAELEEQVRVLTSRVVYLQRTHEGAKNQLRGLFEMLSAGDAPPRQ